MDKETRLVVAAYVGNRDIGNRDRRSGQMLWDRIPGIWKEGSTFYTDFWDSYEELSQKSSISQLAKKQERHH